jgi:hypothetical protein
VPTRARVVSFASAKASPGTTTAALLCAALWPTDVALVEADESGGVLAPRLGLRESPGALQLAGAARDDLELEMFHAHCQQTAGGVKVLVAPPVPAQVTATYRELAPGLAALPGPATLVVDAGRLSVASAVWPLCGAGLVVLVARTRLDEFQAFAAKARDLRAGGARIAALLVGDGPYEPGEFASMAGVDLVGVLPSDPEAAATLRGEPTPRRVARRSALWAPAESVVDGLVALVAPETATAASARVSATREYV